MADGAGGAPGRAAAAEAWTPTHDRWLVAASVMTGTFISVLDTSVVNVALPHMQGNLGATVESISWVVTGYILSNVFIMPLISLVSGRVGRKNFYLASVVLFTITSMMCGAARSLPLLVLFRVLQGFGGGALIPLSQSILLESFPQSERGMAMGIFGLGVVLAPAFGPTVGGWLTTHYSWPWIFYINVPIGAINLFLVQRFVEDPPYARAGGSGRIDWTGLGLLAVGLGALQIMLQKGERELWFQSDLIVWLTVIAVAGLAVFTLWELRTDEPAVNLRILKNVQFASATTIGAILGLGLYASIFVLPLFLQNLLGYPAFDSGLALIPRSLAMAIVFPVAGRLYNRVGPRIFIGAGLAISAYAFWALSRLTLQAGYWDLFWPQAVQGVGFALIFVALSTAAVTDLEKERISDATGLYNVVRRVSGSVGIAIAATMIDNGRSSYHAKLAHSTSLSRQPVREFMHTATAGLRSTGLSPEVAHQKAAGLLEGIVTGQAAMLSFNRIFFVVGLVFAVSFPLVFFLRGGGGDAGAGSEAAAEMAG